MSEAMSSQSGTAHLGNSPGVPLTGIMLLRNASGHVLLVRSTQGWWNLPGGFCEPNEDPFNAAAREVREELGLNVEAGRLLVADYSPASTGKPRAVLHLVFAGPVLSESELSGVRIQEEEITAVEFFPADQLDGLSFPRLVRRVESAVMAAEGSTTLYCHDGKPVAASPPN